MQVTVLGSGGAYRIPYLGCHCAVCEAARADPSERRTTTSLWLRHGEASMLLDAGPDLYHQALREGIERLDGIFLTHAHRDHVQGIECLETIVRYGQEGRRVQIMGPKHTLAHVEAQFDWMLRLGYFDLTPLEAGEAIPFAGCLVTPFEARHHHLPTYGYRVQCGDASLVYLPDVCDLPGDGPLETAPLPQPMVGPDLFFIDGTFDDTVVSGPGHITWQQAARLGARSGAGRTVLVHLSHRVDIARLRQATDEHLLEGYDGLRFEL